MNQDPSKVGIFPCREGLVLGFPRFQGVFHTRKIWGVLGFLCVIHKMFPYMSMHEDYVRPHRVFRCASRQLMAFCWFARMTCPSASLLVHLQGQWFQRETVDSCEANNSVGPISISCQASSILWVLMFVPKNTPSIKISNYIRFIRMMIHVSKMSRCARPRRVTSNVLKSVPFQCLIWCTYPLIVFQSKFHVILVSKFQPILGYSRLHLFFKTLKPKIHHFTHFTLISYFKFCFG